MSRSPLTLLVLAVLTPAARADDAEGSTSVEIIRPARTRSAPPPAPKELDLTALPDAAPTDGRASSERTATSAGAEADARARAAQQKKIEELARKTQEEFRKAANALAGE